MNKIVVNTVKAGAIALTLLTSAACVSTKDMDEVKATAQRADQNATAAQNAANSAATSAANANNTANAAKSSADAAQATANRALQAAQASQASSDAVNEKVDRMFKKSVSK
jgi:methyl-accepting chemotaxis protein